MARFRIGLISDTHGLLRPQAVAFLQGCDRVLHAGDICEPATLEQLAAIAPVTAVRGNNDFGAWAERLDEIEMPEFGAVRVCVIHDLSQLRLDLAAARVRVVVSGHSHKPGVEQRGAVLFVNPGSAGPRRFALPISIGELCIDGEKITARTVELADERARHTRVAGR